MSRVSSGLVTVRVSGTVRVEAHVLTREVQLGLGHRGTAQVRVRVRVGHRRDVVNLRGTARVRVRVREGLGRDVVNHVLEVQLGSGLGLE